MLMCQNTVSLTELFTNSHLRHSFSCEVSMDSVTGGRTKLLWHRSLVCEVLLSGVFTILLFWNTMWCDEGVDLPGYTLIGSFLANPWLILKPPKFTKSASLFTHCECEWQSRLAHEETLTELRAYFHFSYIYVDKINLYFHCTDSKQWNFRALHLKVHKDKMKTDIMKRGRRKHVTTITHKPAFTPEM